MNSDAGCSHQSGLYAVGLSGCFQSAVGVSVSQHGVDEGGQIAALAAADAVQLLGELLIGDGQIGIAGAFTHHGTGHEGVDDSGIGGASLHFHQCLGLRVYGYNVVAVGQCHFLTGGAGFHCVGQLGDFSRLGRIGGGGAGISGVSVLAPQAAKDRTIIAESTNAVNFFMFHSS